MSADSRWGVVLFQTVAFISQTTVVSGQRGLLAVLGSVGGAYSIIFTFAAIVYKGLWLLRARKGWTDTVVDRRTRRGGGGSGGGGGGLDTLREWDGALGTGPGTGAGNWNAVAVATSSTRKQSSGPAGGGVWRRARNSLFGISRRKSSLAIPSRLQDSRLGGNAASGRYGLK